MMKKISNKKNINVVIATLLAGFIIHVPLITKNIITADSLLNSYYYNSYINELTVGRIGLYIMGLL